MNSNDLIVRTIFLSTPSVRRATVPRVEGKEAWDISIHALREEGDCAPSVSSPALCYFDPRPP